MRNRKLSYRLSILTIFGYIFIAVFAPLIANEKPLYFSTNNKIFLPALNNNTYIELTDSAGNISKVRINSIDWKKYSTGILHAPVSWSPVHSDLNNILSSPFENQYYLLNGKQEALPTFNRHFLGTGNTGNDVLSALIHGCRNSLTIGIFSMLIAILPGVFLGALAGFFGDNKLLASRGSIILILLMLIPSWFYAFYLRKEIIAESFRQASVLGIMQLFISTFFFTILIFWPILLSFNFSSYLKKRVSIPVDAIISRLIEIFMSLPRLILILTLAAITRPSLFNIILIIGFTSWTEFARITRGQFLLMKNLNFVDAATAMGNKKRRVIFFHMLPNALPQIILTGIFGIASAILIETGLSFLGVGLPADSASWGSLIFQARQNYQAWWLVVFPGLAISLLLLSLFSIAQNFKSKLLIKSRFLTNFNP